MSETTSRGFRAPTHRLEKLQHRNERYLIVRLTDWERRQLRPTESGTRGKVYLMSRPDGTHDLVVLAEENDAPT